MDEETSIKSINKHRSATTLLYIVIIVSLVAVAYLLASPHIMLDRFENAIEQKNRKAIKQYVDFENLRDSLKYEIEKKFMQDLKDNPFAAVLGTQLIKNILETQLSPDMFIKMGDNFNGFNGKIDYVSLNQFNLISETDKKKLFQFERENLFSDWKLTGFPSLLEKMSNIKTKDTIVGNSTPPIKSREEGNISGEKEAIEPPNNTWQIRKSLDEIDDSKIIHALLDAENDNDIYLMVRCKNNRTELMIYWDTFLWEDTQKVTTRVGKEKAITTSWSGSTGKRATFSERPIPLIKKMLKEDKFVARIKERNGTPITAIFNTSGMEEAVQEISETCNWIK